MPGHEPTPEEYREAGREMAATGHPFLAQELIKEAEERERLARQDNDTDKEH